MVGWDLFRAEELGACPHLIHNPMHHSFVSDQPLRESPRETLRPSLDRVVFEVVTLPLRHQAFRTKSESVGWVHVDVCKRSRVVHFLTYE